MPAAAWCGRGSVAAAPADGERALPTPSSRVPHGARTGRDVTPRPVLDESLVDHAAFCRSEKFMMESGDSIDITSVRFEV